MRRNILPAPGQDAGLGTRFAAFLAGLRYESIPSAAVKTVADAFTDCVAVAIAGRDETVSRIMQRFVPAAADGEARLLIAGKRASSSDAALVNGTAAHALDFDDTGFNGHIGAVLVPAILAESDAIDAGGKAMVTAFLGGYELWGELHACEPDSYNDKGWHPTAVLGTVCAAASIGVLRRLDAARMRHALGIAASLAGGLMANFGSMTKPFHAGRAAQAGIQAVRLALAGMTASSDAIEHQRGFLRALSPRGVVDVTGGCELGSTWRILTTGLNIKRYPICYATHRSLDQMLALRQRHRLEADAIAQLDIAIAETSAANLPYSRPPDVTQARFSMEFAAAAAFIAGRCTVAELNDVFIGRRDVQAFFEKVHVDTSLRRDDPAHPPSARLTLRLRDGTQIEAPPLAYPRGHFANPLHPGELRRKFDDCVSGMYGEQAADALFAALQAIEQVKTTRDLPLQ